jgi:hypothetical protein
VIDHHVVRLDVAVHDAVRVRVVHVSVTDQRF